MGIYKGLHCLNTDTTMPQKAFHSLFTRVSCAFKGNRQAPKSHPTAISLGFRQNGQNLERLERLRPEQKTVFEGVSLQRGIKNDPPSNASNGLGNSKGLRERKGCSRVGRGQGQNPEGHSYSTASDRPGNKPRPQNTHLCHLTPTLPPPVH